MEQEIRVITVTRDNRFSMYDENRYCYVNEGLKAEDFPLNPNPEPQIHMHCIWPRRVVTTEEAVNLLMEGGHTRFPDRVEVESLLEQYSQLYAGGPSIAFSRLAGGQGVFKKIPILFAAGGGQDLRLVSMKRRWGLHCCFLAVQTEKQTDTK